MKSLIEYLLVFLAIIAFFPNNYLTIAYLCLSLIAILIFVITYLKNSKGKEHLKLEKQLDPKLLVTIVMMLLVNVILKIEIFNLLFGFAWLIYFIVYYIRCCLKKDLCFEKELINEEYLFNSYIILYLISAIIKLNL